MEVGGNRCPDARFNLDEGLTPSEVIVRAVSEAEGREFSDGPLLYEAVDPEALDEFFQTCRSGRVEFEYSGYVVVAESDGAVFVGTAEEDED